MKNINKFAEPILLCRVSKTIARITLCMALAVGVCEEMSWNPSASEQIKNLSKIDWRNQWTVKFYFEGRTKKR